MFGAHIPELMIVMVLALVVFGPKRLPEIGSSMGKGIRDFKRHVSDDNSETARDARSGDVRLLDPATPAAGDRVTAGSSPLAEDQAAESHSRSSVA
jgi:sec-independent protein translocase protein TatA